MDDIKIAAGIVDLAYLATGGSDMGYLMDYLEGPQSTQSVQRLFEREGVGWGTILESDVERVLRGYEAEHFLDHRRWAEIFRARRSIRLDTADMDNPEVYILRGEDIYRETITMLERRRRQVDEYGVSLAYFESGHACLPEANYFYSTIEWKHCASAMRFIARGRCEICGQSRGPLHVHHSGPIISMFHYNFDLNFADYKLKTMCATCHSQFHRRAIRSHGSYNYIYPVTDERHAEYLERLKKLSRAHDRLRTCEFCRWNKRFS